MAMDDTDIAPTPTETSPPLHGLVKIPHAAAFFV